MTRTVRSWPRCWIVHVPRLKSGLPIRGGLARLVALAFMVKAYAITDWVAFAEVFGMPLRLGRYGETASEDDILTLIRAVSNLGTDAAAVIPDSMRVEFTEPGSRAGGADLFEKLAVYLDKQVSKAVLGQTMTADDGSSMSQAKVHDEVRGDILRSDARELADTLNRDLVRPFIDLNYGPRERGMYPRLTLPVPEPEDIQALTAALEKLVPLRLRVEASVVRDKLGLPDPEDGAELLSLRDPHPGPLPAGEGEPARNRRRALNRSANGDLFEKALAAALEAAEDPERIRGMSEELVRPLLDAADEDPEGLLGRLAEMYPRLDSSALQERLSRALFAASLWGGLSADAGGDA